MKLQFKPVTCSVRKWQHSYIITSLLQCPCITLPVYYNVCSLQCPYTSVRFLRYPPITVSVPCSVRSLQCRYISVSVPCNVRSLQCRFLAVSRWRRWWRWFCRSVITWTEEPSADRLMGMTLESSLNYATSSPWYVAWPHIRVIVYQRSQLTVTNLESSPY